MTPIGTLSREVDASTEVPAPRQDWEQYQRMAENGDDALLDGDLSSMTKWDETDWEW